MSGPVNIVAVAGHQIDLEHPAVTTIEYEHQRIHEGRSFTTYFTNTVTNINEKTVIAFNIPTGYEIHVTATLDTTGAGTFYLYKDTAIDVGEGTEQTPVNRHQDQGTVPTSVLKSVTNPQVANRVTTYTETQAASNNMVTTYKMDQQSIVAGAGPKAAGGNYRGNQEWIFEGPVQIAFVLNSETNDDSVHNIRLDWYEEKELD